MNCCTAIELADPHCKRCKGSGWLQPCNEQGVPDYSKLPYACTAPGCYRDTIRQSAPAVRPQSHLVELQTFATFKIRKGVKEAWAAAKALSEDPTQFPFLILSGPTGTGKTHLCNAVALVLAQKGMKVRLITVDNMLTEMFSDSTGKKIQEYQEIDVLVLDDYFEVHSKVGSWYDQKIQQIINERERQFLPTMITTNLAFTEIPDRLFSRISGIGKMEVINASDYRSDKAKSKQEAQ